MSPLSTNITLETPSWLNAFDVSDGTLSSVTYNRGACSCDAITAAFAAEIAASALFGLIAFNSPVTVYPRSGPSASLGTTIAVQLPFSG